MSKIAEAIGPVYDTAGAQKVLRDVGRRDLAELRRRGEIVAMKAADGMWVYPVW